MHDNSKNSGQIIYIYIYIYITENQSLVDHERMNCNRRKSSIIWRESIFQLEERENEGFCRGVI